MASPRSRRWRSGTVRRGQSATAPVVLSVVLTACSTTPPPPEGDYRGEMCVASAGQPANCGPVQLRLTGEVAQVQVSDIGYHLFLRHGQLDLVLMHGAMRIDSFSAPYAWKGPVLRFTDPDKGVRYQIRFAELPNAPMRTAPP